MATFVADLPETKTEANAHCEWVRAEGQPEPVCGLLRIVQRRCTCTYAVCERNTKWQGRAFEVVKAEGEWGSDREEERYWVFVSHSGNNDQCSCRGWEKWAVCKHLSSLRLLIEAGQV